MILRRSATVFLVAALCAIPTGAQTFTELPVPTGNGAAQPFLFAGQNGSVLMSWMEPVAGTDRVALRFARLANGKWSSPRTIIERNDFFVNWADFPSIVEDVNGVLFAHWLQKNGPGVFDYDVRISISRDGGATWSKSFAVHRDGTQSEHGFASLVPLPRGGIGAVWLDGRKMTKKAPHGDMTIRYATIAADGKVRAEAELDTRACECCASGMTYGAEGPVIVYRDRTPKEVRDISWVRRTKTGWTKPRPVHNDTWTINGCPVNGPQIDAAGRTIAVAWFTAAENRGRALLAFSSDGGATFGKPIVIDDGTPVGRVDVVMLDADVAFVSWIEQRGSGAEIRGRRVHRTGKTEPAIKIADSSSARAAGFPRMSRSGKEVFIAWTEHGATAKRVHVARAIR